MTRDIPQTTASSTAGDRPALEMGVLSFGSVPRNADGTRPTDAEVIRQAVELGVLAEQVGLDVFSLGEHHRVDFLIPAPEVALAAIAARTERIKLGTAVTVLSTDDPVRLYQRFATLDAISGGRAEPILGRGSFTESFPLFGFNLSEYDLLFEERLNLWAALRAEGPTTWEGQTRPALSGQSVYPRTDTAGGIPTWVGVGGNPESVVRAARYGFNLMLASLGQTPARLRQYIALFERALEQYGMPRPRIAISAGAHVAETDEQAREQLWPHHYGMIAQIGSERGWPPPTRHSFDDAIASGMHWVGSPETVARMIATLVTDLGVDRVDLNIDTAGLPNEHRIRSVELIGTKVLPRVRELVTAQLVQA